jgi:TPR repeat protein
MTLKQFLSELALLFSAPDKQLSEALRLWNLRDDSGALKWGRRAARHLPLAKVAVAQWLLFGNIERKGQGTDEAIKLLKEAANAGLPEAQQVLGGCYLEGTGVRKDAAVAFEWIGKAAASGSVTCQLEMVRYYTSGQYREPDVEAARRYAELAAAAGHSEVLAALVQDLNAEKSSRQSPHE